MANIKYWREVANSGRGSTMTACLHAACDELDSITKAKAECLAAITFAIELGEDAAAFLDDWEHGDAHTWAGWGL